MSQGPDRRAPPTRHTGFWGAVERQVLLLQSDPERRALAFRIAWWLSTAVVILGFLIIFYTLITGNAVAQGPGEVTALDLGVVQSESGDVWTIRQAFRLAPVRAEGDSSYVGLFQFWMPPEAENLVLQSRPGGAFFQFEVTSDSLARADWTADSPPHLILVQFTLQSAAPPDYGVPMAVPLSGHLVLAPGHAPPASPLWAPVDATERAFAFQSLTLAPGTRVPLAATPPAPPGGPAVLTVLAAASALAWAAGAAWSARRTPRLAPGADAGLLDHLRELQSRLVVVVVPFALLFVLFFGVGFVNREVALPALGATRLPLPVATPHESVAATAFRVLAHQFVPPGVALVVVRPIDAALTQLLVALFLAFVAIVPLAAHQVGAFLSPGLLDKEKSFIRRAVPVVVLLFLAGAVFAYLVMVPVTIRVLYGYATALDAAPLLAVSDLVTFAVVLTTIFGVSFELPVVMVGLARLGVVRSASFASHWRHAVVGIFFLSAIVTPDPTIVSMVLLSVPLIGLYALGVLAARAAERAPG